MATSISPLRRKTTIDAGQGNNLNAKNKIIIGNNKNKRMSMLKTQDPSLLGLGRGSGSKVQLHNSRRGTIDDNNKITEDPGEMDDDRKINLKEQSDL